MKNTLLNILFFLFSIHCFSFQCETSECIELIRFNDGAQYNPGSGVSMHINPVAIFVLEDLSNLQAVTNNAFHLELSNPGGDFTNPISLGIVYDFYTPLMNGVIPVGTSAGQYKLRVRSTNPVSEVVTNLFTIDNSVISALPTVETTMQSNTNYFECLNDLTNMVNPFFGSLKQPYNALVADIPSSYEFLQVAASNPSYTLNINLIDINSVTTTSLTAISPGVYSIPETLSVGAYNFEIEEIDLSGNSSVFSATFVFHASATTFGNASSEIVCVGEEVVFSVDITNLGIGSNYMGSYYTFDFGDGTPLITKTQAELLADYTSPLNPLIHVFSQPSCGLDNTNFILEMILYNKGLSVGGTTPACDEYIANGSGAEKEVTTSETPVASFTLDSEQCISENIVAINTSTSGTYPTPSGECSADPDLTWYYKPPTATAFIPVLVGSPWLVGSNLIIPAGDIIIPGCWEIKLTAINEDFCQLESEYTDTINIEDEPDADFNIIKDNQEVSQICLNNTVILTDNSNITEAACDETLPNEDPTYQWSISPNSGYTLENSTTLNSQNPELTFTTEGTYTITLEVTTECATSSHTEILNVIGVLITDKEITICSGGSFVIAPVNNSPTQLVPPGTTYDWGIPVSNPIGAITGGDAADNQTTISQTTLTNLISEPATLTYSVTASASGCEGDPFEVVITVNPYGNVNAISNQIVCNGDSTLAVTFLTSNTGAGTATYNWTNDNTTIGLQGDGIGNIPSFTATSSAVEPIVGNITVTPVYENNGVSCFGTPETFSITVKPSLLVNFSEADQVIVTGETTTSVNLTSPTTGVTLAWTASVSVGITGVTTFTGTNNIPAETLTNLTGEPLDIVYTAVATSAAAVDCPGLPTDYTVTVNPLTQVNQIDDKVYCNGDGISIEFTTINDEGTTFYSWTNDNPEIGLLDGVMLSSGTGNIDLIATNNTNSPITGTIVVTPSFNNGADTSTDNSMSFTITVNPTGQVNTVDNQIVSNGFNTIDINFSTTNENGNTTYAWTNSNASIGLAASGIGIISAFTGINTGTFPIISTLEVTPTFTNNGVSCIGAPESFIITVNPIAQVNFTENLVVSNGETVTIPFTTINTGGTSTYTWTNTDPDTGLTTSGSSDIGFIAVNTGTSPITTTIIIEPDFENGGNGNTGPTETFTITINPVAQIDPIDNMVICNQDNTTDVIFTTENTGGVTTYTWVNDNTTIGLQEDGIGNIPSFTATNVTTSIQVANIIVTPTFSNGGNSNTGPTETFTITVNPTAQVNSLDDIISCEETTIEEIVFTTQNTDGTTTYSWTNDNTSIGLQEDGIGNIPSFTSINSSNTTINSTITVIPSYESNGVVCIGAAETFTITVNPSSQIDTINDLVFCNNETSSIITFTSPNTDGTTTYSWNNDNTSIGLQEDGIGNILSFTATNVTTSIQVANIIVIPTYDNNGVECIGAVETFTITVNPSSQIDTINDLVFCNNETTSIITFTSPNTDGTTTYSWSNNNTSIGLQEDGIGNIPSFTSINSSNTTINSTITVIPSYESNGVVCIGAAETFTITVNPSSQIDTINDLVFCNNETSSIITFTSPNTDGTTTYSWSNNNTSIGLQANGIGNIPSFTLTNSSNTAINSTITVIPTYDNNGVVCIGAAETFTITVRSEIVVSGTPSDAVDCNNLNSGSIDLLVSGGSGAYSFLWSNGADTEDLSNIPAGEYTVEVSDSEGCTPQSETFTISRQDDLIVDLQTTVDPNCIGNFVSQINDITVSGGVPPYSINWSSGSVSVNDNTIMTSYENGTYTVLVTDSLGCQVETEINVDFDELGDASFDYSTGENDCGISIYNEVLFTNTSSGDYISVTWNFGDGSPTVSGDSVLYTYPNPGAYTITQTVEYSYGCIDISTQEIEVIDGYNIVLPTAFSPNGDGRNDTIRPVYTCVNSIEMFVYDTFGSLIYYENNIDLTGWDGILKGRESENGNYLLVVKGVSIYQEDFNRQGVFTLLR